ncbi:hypothetical protein D9757_001472 [Collybiopsis confluens]|uniref:Uncharacterized protein n=1 Tax=Collybiopsis confluens TaxID=2823264 RepID=A0A8H5HZE1_9AGAR|nr:hypothetical protein D9757_001472 [Collybiopsis confluens]
MSSSRSRRWIEFRRDETKRIAVRVYSSVLPPAEGLVVIASWMQYAKALSALITDNIGEKPLTVWTSTLKGTIQTAQYLLYTKFTWKSLDELDAGCGSFQQAYPDDSTNRDEDKFNYRYRRGESYRDVVVRLEPVFMELERQENILSIGH